MFGLLQRILPKHLLSRIVGWVANSELPFIKDTFIGVICFFYDIDLSEAVRTDRRDYKSFNDFFTRELRPGVRKIRGTLCSPADGKVAALGNIDGDTLIQSKNHTYSLKTLVAEDSVEDFSGGSFITIYLAPHNYHRVHTPRIGELHRTKYVPGNLFSVNQSTANSVHNLFAKNERLVCHFRTGEGPMVAVLVGAMLVAGIKPAWLDRPYKPGVQVSTEMKRVFHQGQELGQFQMGSTVILLMSKAVNFVVSEGELVKVGQSLTT
jgi:phosphatidylserine decarboxylase